ncbi:cysteine proteinase RD21a-like [Prunus yedoensis var. nudiflora]|uniref:Cysteine proteinase RD21a-like n=1 Tax=Prunus yedoensis var. nudiflora TaxID=2094558 RepID=A0A314ZEQ7_PRUYE|nr:cysteine proteinase RD21a-like [Prunus yedoensis var. nudiflora]
MKYSPRSSGAMTSLACMALFMLLGLSTAMDMSIIDYDDKHGMGVPSDRTEAEVKALYESWLVKHRKNYNALGEKERRFEIFKDNLRFVDEHNKQSRSYKVGLNRFADLTNEEYRSIYLGAKVDRRFRLSGSERVTGTRTGPAMSCPSPSIGGQRALLLRLRIKANAGVAGRSQPLVQWKDKQDCDW